MSTRSAPASTAHSNARRGNCYGTGPSLKSCWNGTAMRDKPLYDGHGRQPGAAKRGRVMRNKRNRRNSNRRGRQTVEDRRIRGKM